jgi:GNAT superfamily N-acetyltransferase
MSDRYVIRTMSQPQVAMAIDWAAQEGWNPGWHDAACFRAADPNGFLVGLLDDEPIATISVVKYGVSLGFLGLYIVKPARRGRGYGLRLWNAGLAYLRERTIGLDGVVAQQGNYRRSGFALAYRNVRSQGYGHARAGEDSRIVQLSTVPFDELNAYDRAIFRADRTAFLKCWIEQPHATAIGLRQAERLAGYAIARPARVGFKIGPLFADDPQSAQALFDAACASVPPGTALYLDVPECNSSAVELAQRSGMTIVFETARMYAGRAPDVPAGRVFGVTTFELG